MTTVVGQLVTKRGQSKVAATARRPADMGGGGGDRCSAGYLARKIVMDLWSMRAGCLRWRPAAGQFVQPPGVVARIELPMLLHGPVKVVADHGCDHVHDVVPVVAPLRSG